MSAVFENLETYRSWDRLFYSPAGERFFDHAVPFMLNQLGAKPGDTVLDAGCGIGVHSLRAARMGLKVHAIDFSSAALAEASRRAQAAGLSGSIRFEEADLTRLALPDASYSRVFSWGVLIHIPEVDKALDSLARILEPGGRLALYLNQKDAIEYRTERMLRGLFGKKLENFRRLQFGYGHLYRGHGDEIWIWQLDANAIIDHLAARGVHLVKRLPGAFTELFVRLPEPGASMVHHFNRACFKLGALPSLALSNLMIFEKRK
jgi:SAM-dependent methyltransferase